MQTEVNPVSVPWTRKRYPLILNGVLEHVLVCAHFFFQTLNMVPKVYALLHSYLDCLEYLRFVFIFMPKLCSGGFKLDMSTLFTTFLF